MKSTIANLLKSVNKKNELITWENIFIHKHAHHIMNMLNVIFNNKVKQYWRNINIKGKPGRVN